MLTIATGKEVELLLFHMPTKYGSDRFRQIFIDTESGVPVPSFFMPAIDNVQYPRHSKDYTKLIPGTVSYQAIIR